VRKNCSSDQEKNLKFEAEGREFANFLRSLEQFVRTVKGQNLFLEVSQIKEIRTNHNSNWKKLLGFRNMQEKLEKEYVIITQIIANYAIN
jgi:hypothetical protein